MKIRNLAFVLVLCALCALLAAGCAPGAKTEDLPGFAPVNPDATPEAKQLLGFLYSIQGRHTLTGQHNFASDLGRYEGIVYNMTGLRPVVWGADFSFMAQGDNAAQFQHCGPMNLTAPFSPCETNGRSKDELRQGIIDEAKRKYAEGRIITLMWHNCFPTGGDECNGDDIWRLADRLPSREEWSELVADGTELNKAWKKQLDGVVPYLRQLRDARIPVLWRPYHEMNGVWFWWCNKPGEDGFKKLWVNMYDYFTKHHKLDNLIWVWDANAPRDKPGDEAYAYKDFFPGLDYVDILAADVYGDWKQSHHDELAALGQGKLVALGEVGNAPAAEVSESQPQWSWFMVWGYGVYDFSAMMAAMPPAPPAGEAGKADEAGKKKEDAPAPAPPPLAQFKFPETNPALKAAYEHPHNLTLDEIDFSGKTYKLKTLKTQAN